MKVEDPVPHRQGWTLGLFERDRGMFHVSVFHAGAGVGVRVSGRTREDVIRAAQREIDALYAIQAQRWQGTDPVEESVTLM